MSKVTLRELNLTDIQEMSLWPEFEAPQDSWANLILPNQEEMASWLQRYHQPPMCNCLAIQDLQGNLVGRGNLAVLDVKLRVGGLFNFAISPYYAGQGFAQRALRELLDFGFGNLSLACIYLYTLAEDAKARHLYSKLGFVEVGSHMDEHTGLGEVEYVDLVAWAEK